MSIRRPLQEDRTAIPTDAPPMYSVQPQQSQQGNNTTAASPRQASVNAGRFQTQQQPPQQMYAPPSMAPVASSSSSARPMSMTSQSLPSEYQKQQQQQQQSSNPFQDPPARPVSGPQATGANLNRTNSREDKLAILRRYDTALLVDDSASMYPLWHEAETALAGIVQTVITYDADGIDVHFLNSTHSIHGAKSPHEIRELFQYVGPVGESTPTEMRVEQLLSPYIEACERAKKQNQSMPKPLNMIVLTDGEADDGPTLAYVLTGFAKRLDEIRAPLTQLGVQFVQIGNAEEATEALRELDDELSVGGVRDMVDTVPYAGEITSEFLIKVALGAINRKIDRQT